jgi:hypothetical protein
VIGIAKRRAERVVASGVLGAYVLDTDCPLDCPRSVTGGDPAVDPEATAWALHLMRHHRATADTVRAICDLLTVNSGTSLTAPCHWHDKGALMSGGWLPFWCEWTHIRPEGECGAFHSALPEHLHPVRAAAPGGVTR